MYEWRNSFGSAAIATLLTFFSESDRFTSDENRVLFAKNMKNNMMFLYSNTDADDCKVRNLSLRHTFGLVSLLLGMAGSISWSLHRTSVRHAYHGYSRSQKCPRPRNAWRIVATGGCCTLCHCCKFLVTPLS